MTAHKTEGLRYTAEEIDKLTGQLQIMRAHAAQIDAPRFVSKKSDV